MFEHRPIRTMRIQTAPSQRMMPIQNACPPSSTCHGFANKDPVPVVFTCQLQTINYPRISWSPSALFRYFLRISGVPTLRSISFGFVPVDFEFPRLH